MPLRLRNAALNDGLMLFDWRNDPATRAGSHNSDELELEGHMRWVEATLTNPRRELLIVEEDGMAVGTVRIDLDELGGSAEMSWTVAPGSRGHGVGKRMVAKAASVEPWCSLSLRAEVKEGNTASRRIAEAAGMQLTKLEDGVMHFERTGSAL